MFNKNVETIKKGQSKILWPDLLEYFAKTSGTTSGAKYIPLTKASMPFHIKAARNAILSYIHETGKADFVDGKKYQLTLPKGSVVSYFDELQKDFGEDEMQHYRNLFKSEEEIEQELQDIKETLFSFNTLNAEIFQQQISQIQSREEMLKIVKALRNAKELNNLIRFYGFEDLLEKIDFFKLGQLLREAQAHLDNLNFRDQLENSADTTNLLNVALEDIIFMFRKVSEEELILADQLKNQLRLTREALLHNFDTKDPQFISLKKELERMFKNKNLDEISQEEMRENIFMLHQVYEKVKELNRRNELLSAKYKQDEKYARIHKRLMEKKISKSEINVYEALKEVKKQTDEDLLNNNNLLYNESFFEKYITKLVMQEFVKNKKIIADAPTTKYIGNLITNEYLTALRG